MNERKGQFIARLMVVIYPVLIVTAGFAQDDDSYIRNQRRALQAMGTTGKTKSRRSQGKSKQSSGTSRRYASRTYGGQSNYKNRASSDRNSTSRRYSNRLAGGGRSYPTRLNDKRSTTRRSRGSNYGGPAGRYAARGNTASKWKQQASSLLVEMEPSPCDELEAFTFSEIPPMGFPPSGFSSEFSLSDDFGPEESDTVQGTVTIIIEQESWSSHEFP